MEIELKEINLNIVVIENLFKMIENEMVEDTFLSKIVDMTPFKGGLPKVPLIVGLIFGVPDKINNLISKFVGSPIHPIAKALQKEICRIYKIKTFGKFENEKLRKCFYQSIFDEITSSKASGVYCGGKRISSLPVLRHRHCCYYSHDWNNRLNPKLTGLIWKQYWTKGDLKTTKKERWTEDERCYYCKKAEYDHFGYNNLNGYKN